MGIGSSLPGTPYSREEFDRDSFLELLTRIEMISTHRLQVNQGTRQKTLETISYIKEGLFLIPETRLKGLTEQLEEEIDSMRKIEMADELVAQKFLKHLGSIKQDMESK